MGIICMQFLSSIVLNVSTFLFVNCYANQQLFSSPPRAPPALIPKWYYIIVTMHRSQRRHNFIIICHNSPPPPPPPYIHIYIYLTLLPLPRISCSLAHPLFCAAHPPSVSVFGDGEARILLIITSGSLWVCMFAYSFNMITFYQQ